LLAQVLQKLMAVTSPRAALLEAGLAEKLVERASAISALSGEDKEDAQTELDLIALLQNFYIGD